MCLYLTAVNVLFLLRVTLFATPCNASPDSTAIGASLDSSVIPVLASGKRQHNIMRFGKRPSPGNNLIHFGKRPVISSLPDILDYFQQQKNQRDNSHKRGHTIMRFGKRAGPPESSNSVIHFRRSYYHDDEDMAPGDGHSVMYTGQRDRIVPYSAAVDGEREGSSITHFDETRDEKKSHAMIHFGKRESEEGDDGEEMTKREHNLLRFGKKSDTKGSHAMIHFGKRESAESDNEEQKMAKREQHNLLRFGKRSDMKGVHTMIHIGKLESEESDDGEEMKKREHNLLRFGKKSDRKGSHAMIHFGKRIMEDGKRTPIFQFGGMSDDEKVAVIEKLSESRRKRESGPFRVHYEKEEEVPTVRNAKELIFDNVNEALSPDEFSFEQLVKKDSVKNAFLRFG